MRPSYRRGFVNAAGAPRRWEARIRRQESRWLANLRIANRPNRYSLKTCALRNSIFGHAGQPMNERSSGRAERLITLKDIVTVAKIAVGGIVVWAVPQRFWLPLSRIVTRGIDATDRAQTRRTANRVRAVAGNRLALHPVAVLRELSAMNYMRRLQILKVHSTRGFHPPIEVIGREHIDTALEHGRGTILWAGMFVSASLIEPMALHQAGIPLYHLSNRIHGLSNTRFAHRWLNPLITAAENQYLAERIVRTPGFLSALVTMRKRLEENRVVGMRASDGARHVLDLPFLDGRIKLATGPVELAMITGAEVLPMFVVHNDAGEYEVHVEAPIKVRKGGDRKKAVADATAEFVARLEPYVVSYPSQWMGWDDQVRAKDSEDDQAIIQMPGAEHPD